MVQARPISKSVVFIMGPTASGKTRAAIHMAQNHGCELINADAAQVYTQMNIGTAKPSKQELDLAPHRLLDFVDPANPYSAAQFCTDAQAQIEAIHENGKQPVLVGGSMFYFRALEQGLSALPAADPQTRGQIEQQARDLGWPALHQLLCRIDPDLASRIDPNDPQRIQRALEIHQLTGKQPSLVFAQHMSRPMPYRATKIVIAPYARSQLHQRISQRFRQMLEAGLIEEVEALRRRGDLSLDTPAMRTVGYRQVWQFLDNEFDHKQMTERAIAATRQLAKRQLTWLRNQRGLVWFSGTGKLDLDTLDAYFGVENEM